MPRITIVYGGDVADAERLQAAPALPDHVKTASLDVKRGSDIYNAAERLAALLLEQFPDGGT